MKRLLLLLMVLLMTGCGCLTRTVYVEVPVKADSVYVEKVIKDTVRVEIPGDSIRVVAVDSSHLENRYSKSDASVDSTGRLHHSLVNKNIKIEKEIVYKEKKVEVVKEVPVEVQVTKEVKVVPGYYRWCSRILWIILGIFVIFIVLRGHKFFP